MKKIYTFFSIFAFSLLVNAQAFNWEWQNPKPNGNDQNSVVVLDANNVISFGTASTIQKSSNGGTSWSVSYIDNAYRDIKSAVFVNSTIGYLAGTAGLLLKTTDAGSSWNVLTSGTTEDLLSIDFFDKDTGYVSGSNGVILKTTNGGNSWAVSAYGTSYIYKVYVNSASTIFLGSSSATTGRIIRSTDYGTTWQSVTPTAFTSGTVYGISFADANTGIAVATGNAIYKTTDGGATWTNKGALGTNTTYAVSFLTATKVLAVDANGGLYVSNDAGETWTSTTISKQKLSALDFINNTIYIAGSAGTLLKSSDGGTTWTSLYTAVTQQMLRDIKFFDANNGLAGGGSATAADSLGQALQTTNGGATWLLVPFNFTAQVYSIARPTASIWYVATGNNKIFKTTDGGSTFTSLTLPITGNTQVYWSIAFANKDTGYAAGASGKLIKTTDGGATWTSLTTNFSTTTIYKVVLTGTNTVYIAGLSAKLSKSTDGGATWTALSPAIAGSFFALAFKDQNTGYLAGSAVGIAKTTDGGATWKALTAPSSLKATASFWSIAFGDSTVWIGSVNGDVIYSNDEGSTWQAAKKPTSSSIFAMSAVGGSLWLAGQGGNIIKGYTNPAVPVELTLFSAEIKNKTALLSWKTATETNNLGFNVERKINKGNWETISFVKGNGTTTVKKEYSYSDLSASGDVSYRLKQIDYDGTFKYSQVVELNFQTPGKFELAQNYPNPFNPTTVINYQIVKAGKVSLKVYDVLGKEIASLVDEEKAVGNYSIQFDAGKFSSGVYYYTLTAGEFSNTKKMILMK
jgi:photosystem II stability/assembly factor-like uncharacterized protein